ncbi:MAG TPA: insulinase family protein [Nitrospinae bacterium]|nr:insulinase family protein [Nitrospinota bacterium]HBA27431.1 insulinase family protein [Nitrospinota bacterium]
MKGQKIFCLLSSVPRLILAGACFFILYLYIPAFSETLDKRVVEHTLKNGMKLLLLERHQSPTIATTVMFKVGSVDERTGMTGIAHLLEHMLFKGTKMLGTKDYKKEKPLLDKMDKIAVQLDAEERKGEKADTKKIEILKAELKKLQDENKKLIIKDEFASIYSKHGGVGYNAGTSRDMTSYIISLPSNKLELWTAIESDRMKNPVLREFYSERDVVMEERRMSYDNDPEGSLFENFLSAAYNAHPYGMPTIGWMSDIKFLPKKEVENFLKTYYAPNNCVVTVVGDIDAKKIIEMMDKYFGEIPPQNIPERVWTEEPEQIGERRIEVEFDANPSIIIGYHKPTLPHYDDYVFDVIDFILGSGRTSRLYKKMVEEKRIAISVSTFSMPGSRYSNLFIFNGVPRAPHTVKELEDAFFEEIERLKNEPVSAKELEKVINHLEAHHIRQLGSNRGMSDTLAYYQTVAGDWKYMMTHIDNIRKITPEDVMNTAKKYLIKNNRTVAVLVKKEGK